MIQSCIKFMKDESQRLKFNIHYLLCPHLKFSKIGNTKLTTLTPYSKTKKLVCLLPGSPFCWFGLVSGIFQFYILYSTVILEPEVGWKGITCYFTLYSNGFSHVFGDIFHGQIKLDSS